MEKVTIETLSRSAGRILSHLSWLPVDVLKTIERYPYHSARCFAEGMEEELKTISFPNYVHKYYYFESPNLCMNEFKAILPQKITILLKELGEQAEQLILNNIDLKRYFNRNNSGVQYIINKYLNDNNTREKIENQGKKFICEDVLDKYSWAIAMAENSGATNLKGLKECWLVINEWVNAYRLDNVDKEENKIELLINSIEKEATPYPIDIYLEDSDELLLDKTDGFERGWPDVIKRNGKYTIVVWYERNKNSVFMTSKQASDLEDIRIPVYDNPTYGNFIVAKKDGKWGVIYNAGIRHFLETIVPFSSLSLSQILEKAQQLLHIECKFVTWDEFHGGAPHCYQKL